MEFEFEFEFEDVRMGGKWGRKEKRMHAYKSCPVLFVRLCVWFGLRLVRMGGRGMNE
jgi:hypothetical protein